MRPSVKSRTVNDVGNFAIGDQRQHPRPVFGIIFEIGVLDDDDVSRSAREAGSQSGTLTSIALVKQDGERETSLVLRAICGELDLAAVAERHAAPDALRLCQIPPQPLRGSVTRAIIDDDDLFWYLGDRIHNFLEYAPDRPCLVVGGNDDG